MNIVFRADASVLIGSGHVMRCLALAEAVRARGATISFLCREEQGNFIDLIEQKGLLVHRLPRHADTWEDDARATSDILYAGESVDWLIIDNYSFDSHWEKMVRKHVRRMMVIDDLANRSHICDLLLDQNFHEGMENRYANLVPAHCSLLLGPRFALLRTEFAAARERLRSRNGVARRLLIFYGGSDLTNETGKTLQAIALLDRKGLSIDVVIGINNPYRKSIEDLAAGFPDAACHVRVDDMAALMSAADLYVGAAGTTTWERCCLGLPSLVVTVADNQIEATRDLAKSGYLQYVGHHDDVVAEDIMEALRNALDNPVLLTGYTKRCMGLVDGLGAQRCADKLLETQAQHH